YIYTFIRDCTVALSFMFTRFYIMRILWDSRFTMYFRNITTSYHINITLNISKIERNVGVITGSYITQVHGEPGLPEDTIYVKTFKHAGQSYGAFTSKGMTIHHTGDANDYVGKGL